jgi:hypothetical protein
MFPSMAAIKKYLVFWQYNIPWNAEDVFLQVRPERGQNLLCRFHVLKII